LSLGGIGASLEIKLVKPTKVASRATDEPGMSCVDVTSVAIIGDKW